MLSLRNETKFLMFNSSLMGKLSAGIPNPCSYINKPARTHAGRSEPMMTARLGQMVTLGLFRLADNNYGCPGTQ